METKIYKAQKGMFTFSVSLIPFALLNIFVYNASGSSGVLYIGIADVIILYLYSRQYRVTKIIIEDDRIVFIEYNPLRTLKTSEYSLLKIDFIYRNGPVSRRRRGNELRVFYDGHPLFDLTPDANGWHDSVITLIAVNLKQAGIKQVFEKFGDKDVEL